MSEIVDLDKKHLWHPFTQEQTAPDPIEIVRAKDASLLGADGKEYLDLISSWWTCAHGHAHPQIAEAVAHQAETLEHVIFAGFTHAPAANLGRKLAAKSPGELDRVFYSDNGSTAVEIALKLAIQFSYNRGDKKKRLLAFEGGYHGDTFGGMSVSRETGFFRPFEELMIAVDFLPYPETWAGDDAVETKEAAALAALDAYLEAHGSETAALIVEPLVQGASGMRMVRPEFLRQVAFRLKMAGVLLIFDEVMTGFGRTGDLFASLKAEVQPDLVCLSKAITGGFMPLAATMVTNEIYAEFLADDFGRAFFHGHSYTANPLGCAAALASMEIFEELETWERIQIIEKVHQERLNALMSHPRIHRQRLTGTIAAFDIRADDAGYTAAIAPRIKEHFFQRGLLIRPLGNVIYLLPPYCITPEQLNRAWDGIEAALKEVN